MKPISCFLFLFVFLCLHKVHAQASLDVSLDVSNTEVESGNPFFYNIRFAIASSTAAGINVNITDILPPFVEFKEVVTSSLVSGSTFNPDTREVTIKLIDPIPAGTTGSIQLNCAFSKLITPDNYVAANKVSISASNAATVISNTVNIKSTAKAPYTIDKEFDSYDAVNKIVVWKTWVNLPPCSNCECKGILAINDVTITDSLPTGAVFVSATNGGRETSPGSGKVVWDFKGMAFDYCYISYKQYFSQVKSRGKANNSDHAPFSEKGVKAFFIYTLGGTTAYHDVNDTAENLPLTKFTELFQLIRILPQP